MLGNEKNTDALELDDVYSSKVIGLSPKPKSNTRKGSGTTSKSHQEASPVDGVYYKNRDLLHPRGSDELSVKASSSEESDSDDEELEERENWTGKLDFLLSCVGFAVGLGNIWRFPFLCYASGGGAFLFPYFCFLGVCGLPLFFLETSYGQFASLSPITVWRICPLFKGIGYGMVLISGIVCVYYNIIITWTFYYLFSTMQGTLPWSTCGNAWNTEFCQSQDDAPRNVTTTATRDGNVTSPTAAPLSSTVRTASEEFWEFNVLERSAGLEHYGNLRWPLFGCLTLAWFIVFLCLCKGVKSSGKVVYVTATFPYLVLTILLIRGMTLPGAMGGIRWYIIPQWEKLASLKVWGDAATQIFFSVGMAWGSLITLASYNKFSNNVFRDAMIVPCINCFTSVFAGLVIFSVLGFMSHSTGVPIEKVVTQGPGLIFIVYPEAVAKMPFSHLWAILFFLMIFTIGLDSQFGMFETMTSAFIDEYPMFLRRRKVAFTAFMCLIEFSIGVPMVYQGGFYLLTLMDWYSSCFSLMLLSLVECVVISWIYGVDRFMKDIELMIGRRPSCYWKLMWKYVTPAIVLFIWAFSLNNLKRASIGKYNYPDWSIILGWCFALLSIIPVPICATYLISQEASGTLLQRILKLLQPAVNFGPAKTEDRDRYYATFDEFDWLRFNAVRAGKDWRTFQAMQKNQSNKIVINVTNSNNMGTGMLSRADENMSNFSNVLTGQTTYTSIDENPGNQLAKLDCSLATHADSDAEASAKRPTPDPARLCTYSCSSGRSEPPRENLESGQCGLEELDHNHSKLDAVDTNTVEAVRSDLESIVVVEEKRNSPR